MSAVAVLDRDRQRLVEPLPLSFTIDAEHQADRPPESRGTGRDDVRLLVSRGLDTPQHTTFASITRPPATRRPPRRQHVGDRRRRPRRRHRGPRRRRHPRLQQAAWRPLDGRTSTTHRQRVDGAPPAARRTCVSRVADGSAAVPPPAHGPRLRATLARHGRRRRGRRGDDGRRRPTDPLPVRTPRLAPRCLPDRVRNGPRQRRDAECGTTVHRRRS